MTYREALDFLYSSLPMYQRIGRPAYKSDLENTLEMDAWFGHPHRNYPTIHVAGTNGKGSVSHMLASVCQAAGKKTGLYTSPHLLDFRERIRISGEPIPEEAVTGFVTGNRELIDRLRPSFFETTAAMAFDWFARQQVDLAVVETGLGGRLDSTNIIVPELSVITNISLDHTEFLGNDVESIAREKGGIIKPGVPLVIGPTGERTEQLLLRMAEEKNAPVTLAGKLLLPAFRTYDREGRMIARFRDTRSGKIDAITCDLAGDYQLENLSTALTAIGVLRSRKWDLSGDAVLEGLAGVRDRTGILGRWQTLGHNPRSICDTAHNQAGIRAVFEQVMQIPWRKLHVVWGMSSDKDAGQILPLLPKGAFYYFTRSSVPRSLEPALLRENASEYGLNGDVFGSVKEAYRAAKKKAGESDLIFTGGSTFVVADLLRTLGY